MANDAQVVTWDANKHSSLSISLLSGGGIETGVAHMTLHSTQQWSGDNWKLFYDNATLIYGSDENPGCMYTINVHALDKLLGTNYRELEDDRVAAEQEEKTPLTEIIDKVTQEGDLHETYATLVVSMTDSGDMIVFW